MEIQQHSSEVTAEEYRLIVEGAKSAILVIQDGRFVFANQAARQVTRGSIETKDFKGFVEMIRPDFRPVMLARQKRLTEGEALDPIEFVVVPRPGVEVWVQANSSRIQWRGRPAFLALISDITSQKNAEKALTSSEARYAELVAQVQVGICEVDVSAAKFEQVNPAFCQLFGFSREEILSLGPDKVFSPEASVPRRLWSTQILSAQDQVESQERMFKTKDGRVVWLLLHVRTTTGPDGRVHALVLAHDVTAKRKAELELTRMEKLESLGVLAGGIAHDFNNILTAVLGTVSLARLSPSRSDLDRLLAETEKACLRAKDLTQQLLTFSKGGTPIRKTVDIQTALKDWVVFALRGSSVQCTFEIPPDLWSVDADESQISQVIHNLILNADQAMPRGGVIGVSAENTILASNSGLPLKPGKYVVISVVDRGQGIAAENMSRIFDPFFTTKPSGSGLGLATAYSIINKHGGHIRIESSHDVGTAVYVYLPVGEAATQEVAPLAAGEVAGQRGTILMMDDDEAVRRVGEEMLRRLGYNVVVTCDGMEAIRAYTKRLESGSKFDAVIMDLTVPGGMGGLDAIAGLMRIDPKVRAIVSSGYANAPILAEAHKYGFGGVVTKPFTLADLDEALCELSNSSEARALDP